jgi:nucleotide-binding universal stress UspA family protein
MIANPLPVLAVPVRPPQVTRILVPIDFSEASKAALWRAIDIAKIYRSSLVLVHVMCHQTSNGMATVLPGAMLKLELDLQADLDALQKLADTQGVPSITLLRKGPVSDNIRDILVNQSIDLLVLATHGGRGVHGLFLGSTAERLIRAIPIPVLTVGSARNQPDWDEKGARHILFAGDFTPETLCGLSRALAIQQATGAKVSVIQAVPLHAKPAEIRAIRERIESLVPPGTDIYVPEGPVGKTVCTVARDLGVGLIALGVHKNTFSRDVFGTGLLEILLNSPCPVLSVRQCDQ